MTQTAATIAKQIGHKALYMIGAKTKKMLAFDDGLIMSVGRNSKRINRVKITLNAMDTYDVEYWYLAYSLKKMEDKSKLITQEAGIYADGLLDSIERNTGLRTSLY